MTATPESAKTPTAPSGPLTVRKQLYAGYGAGFGLVVGTWLLWASLGEFQRSGHAPAYALEGLAFLYAPPFGLPLAYVIGPAAEWVLGSGRAWFLAWVFTTPLVNWTLVGWLIGVARDRWRRSHRRSARGGPGAAV